MNLGKKKELAARTLKVGKERVSFIGTRLNEIKESITKQDIKDLKRDGAIVIKEISGRRKIEGRKNKRGPGKIKKKIKTRKKDYMVLTRKLRKHVKGMKQQGDLSNEDIVDLRKKIRNKLFRSKAHMKESIGGVKR